MEFNYPAPPAETSDGSHVSNTGVSIVGRYFGYFDGAKHMEMSAFKLQEWSDFHITMRYMAIGSPGVPQVLMSISDCGKETSFRLSLTNDRTEVFLATSAERNGVRASATISSQAINPAGGHIVDVYFSGSRLNLYIDKSYITGVNLAGKVFITNCAPLIGAEIQEEEGASVVNFFKGYIDYLCISKNAP